MGKQLNYNGVQYPIVFNFLVFSQWERETGKKLPEIGNLSESAGAVEAVEALTLLYFAVQEGCDINNVEFDLTLKQFIRGIDMRNLGEYLSAINIEAIEGEKENKRQPKKNSKAA